MRQFRLIVTIPLALALQAGIAQEVTDDDIQADTEELEEIVVFGRYQESLRKSLDQKRFAEEITESISAGDIGQLPDTTIADSLSRLPGLYALIDRGNDSLIVSRGLAPGLSIGTLNGRELATAETERTVRYEQFPSELISGAQVYKTQNANTIEGGIGASIDLRTLNPLDFNERGSTLKVAGLYHDRVKERPGSDPVGIRASGSYYDQFAGDTVGIALGFSRNDQPSVVSHYDNWGWNTFSIADVDDDGNPDFAPWGNGPVILTGSEVRTSTMAKIEWKPSDGFSLAADIYYTDWSIREDEDNVWNCCWDNWNDWQDAAGGFTDEAVINNYVVAGTISAGAQYLTQVASRWVQDNSTLAGGLMLEFDAGGWGVEGDLSRSVGERDNIWRGINFSYAGPPVTVRYDFRPERPVTTYIGDSAAHVLDLNNYNPGSMAVSSDADLEDTIDALRLSIGRSFGSRFVTDIDAGVRISKREKTHRSRGWSQSANVGTIPQAVLDSAVGYELDGQLQLIQVSFDVAQQEIFGGLDNANRPYDPSTGWGVTEDTVAAWVKLGLSGTWGSVPVSGNVGVRYVDTEQEGTGTEFVDGAPQPIREGTDYQKVLPSLNLNFELSETQLLRFGLGKSIARAPVDDLRPNRSITLDISASPVFSGSGGNPTLEPFEATYADLSYEWYFAEDALFALALFYKDVGTYIGVDTDHFEINGTPAMIWRPVNGSGGDISGFEVTLQTPLSVLSSVFRDFGINLNYAYLDTNIVEDAPINDPLPLSGLARKNASAILWYFLGGFEARASYSYRSDSTVLIRGGLQTLEAASYLDVSLSYDVTDSAQVKAELSNLTDQGLRAYSNRNPASLGRFREYGRSFSIGLNYKF